MSLKAVTPADVQHELQDPVVPSAREQASAILKEVQENGEKGLLDVAIRLGDLKEGAQHIFSRADCKAAYDKLPADQQAVLQRTAARIKAFAQMQRASVGNVEMDIAGGKGGQIVAPMEVAGCYAPGGRYPLPSSVLMTAITARVAGVKTVWVASPRPVPVTLAAAHLANCDALLAVGGAQAIAAMAFGVGGVPACDVIVGPGNRWVTAAKSLIAGRCAIDMLAGPSEVLVIADHTACPVVIARDLLAQAEHDVDATPYLVTTDPSLPAKVNEQLEVQLATLTTSEVAKVAVSKGCAVVCKDMAEAIAMSDKLAPEHLEIQTEDAQTVANKCNHYGGLFIGKHAAEVLGDYGAGPNHVLPTGGTARFSGGLSVFSFLRVRTWMRIDDPEAAKQQIQDSVALARLEGLEGHARAAEERLVDTSACPPSKKQKS